MHTLMHSLVSLLAFAEIVATIVIMILEKGAIHDCKYLWGFCLMVGCISFVTVFLVNEYVYERMDKTPILLVFVIASLLSAIAWGIYIIETISNDCKRHYKNDYYLLWIFSIVSFWYCIGLLVLLLLIILISCLLAHRTIVTEDMRSIGQTTIVVNPTQTQGVSNNNDPFYQPNALTKPIIAYPELGDKKYNYYYVNRV
jgi:hypothetical protein